MLSRITLALLFGMIVVLFASRAPAEGPRVFNLAEHVKLPEGFVIEQIAGPSLVQHPLHITFDDKGRAYVTEMAGVNRNGKELEKELPNSIKRLVDSKGDGIFDQAQTFADKLTFPGGILWHQGSIYATSFPYLWKFTDTNNDGIADERVPLVGKFGSVGNGADLHGPQLGPDGWLYFCDGRNGHDLTLGDGTKVQGRASGLYRCKPDGTRLERIFAGGMDNPVEVAFTPAGEPLVCTNLIKSNPRHDGILLGVEGAVYPYDVRAVKELPWTGQYLPIMGELGWVAVSSIVRQPTTVWGKAYLDKYLVAEFNKHNLRTVTLTRADASFTIQTEPFLTCTHPDFHPTQLVSAPDGSLILVDTGGWFRNGCPTSQIEKPTVLGGIYRIYQKKQGRLKSYAAQPMPSLPEEALQSKDAATRLAALWSVGRSVSTSPTPAQLQTMRSMLHDANLDIRLTALRFVGQYHDVEAYPGVLELLAADHAALRREAATVLGKLKNPEAIIPLIKALKKADDPFLEHALILALIRLQQPDLTAQGFDHPSPRVQRGVLLALDQMPAGAIRWEHVAPLLQSSDARLKQSALEVMAHHPLWVNDLADYVDHELSRKLPGEHRLEGIKNLIIALAPQARIQQLIADRLACPEELGNNRYMLLEAMAAADVAPWPAVWEAPLAQYLAIRQLDNDLLLQGILVAQVSQKRNYDAVLRSVAESSDRPWPVRMAAAAVALQDGKPVGEPLFDKLLASLSAKEAPTERLAAARAISVASLSGKQMHRLAEAMRQASPLELPWLLTPWEKLLPGSNYRPLLIALDHAPGLAALPIDRLQKLQTKLTDDQQAMLKLLLKKGRPDLAAQRARLDELKPILTGGDAKKGREFFHSAKALCATCHRIGSEGGLIGPNLSTIGAIRTRADLLESILYPSVSLARGYETMVVVTKSGITLTGVLTRETAEALVLTNTQRQEQKVLRHEIEQLSASTVSTMPTGMDQVLQREDLQDLLAYLESLKK